MVIGGRMFGHSWTLILFSSLSAPQSSRTVNGEGGGSGMERPAVYVHIHGSAGGRHPWMYTSHSTCRGSASWRTWTRSALGCLMRRRCLLQRHVRSSTATTVAAERLSSRFCWVGASMQETKQTHGILPPFSSCILIGRVLFVVGPIWTAGVVLHRPPGLDCWLVKYFRRAQQTADWPSVKTRGSLPCLHL